MGVEVGGGGREWGRGWVEILRLRLWYDAAAINPLKNHYVYFCCVYTRTEWLSLASQ